MQSNPGQSSSSTSSSTFFSSSSLSSSSSWGGVTHDVDSDTKTIDTARGLDEDDGKVKDDMKVENDEKVEEKMVRVVCNRTTEKVSDLPVFTTKSEINEKTQAGVFWVRHSDMLLSQLYVNATSIGSINENSIFEASADCKQLSQEEYFPLNVSPFLFQRILRLMELGPCSIAHRPVQTNNFLDSKLTNIPLAHAQLIESWWNEGVEKDNKAPYYDTITALHYLNITDLMSAMLAKVACVIKGQAIEQVPKIVLDSKRLEEYFRREKQKVEPTVGTIVNETSAQQDSKQGDDPIDVESS